MGKGEYNVLFKNEDLIFFLHCDSCNFLMSEQEDETGHLERLK